jgi:hypothetical protein
MSRFQGHGLCDFQGVGIADDRRGQGTHGRTKPANCFERFHHVVTTPPDQPVEDLGKLSVLAGVREFPCA